VLEELNISFLTRRSCWAVVIGGSSSRPNVCRYGVPQGSVLWPTLFALYTSPVEAVVRQHGTMHSVYADDVNLYTSVCPESVSDCSVLSAAHGLWNWLWNWYKMNGMLPNATKSEAILVGTRVQVSRFRQPTEVSIAGDSVACKKSIRSLGIMLDPELSFGGRVDSIISSCNYHIRALRHIRTALSDDLAMTVGRAIVISRIDYCNSLLFKQSGVQYESPSASTKSVG